MRKPTPRTVHILTALTVDGPQVYPVPLHCQELGIFSSLPRAERFLRRCVQGDAKSFSLEPDEFPVVQFDVREQVLDTEWPDSTRRTRVYGPDGSLRGASPYFTSGPRGGRPREPYRYQVGAIVESRYDLTLQLGIVASQPLTPDETLAHWERLSPAAKEMLEDDGTGEPYLVLLEGDANHHHPEECDLTVPRFSVPDDLVARLRGLLKTARVWG